MHSWIRGGPPDSQLVREGLRGPKWEDRVGGSRRAGVEPRRGQGASQTRGQPGSPVPGWEAGVSESSQFQPCVHSGGHR